MRTITLDIETIPGQAEWIRSDIKVTAPGNYKKQESIDNWMTENAEKAIEEKYAKCGLNAATGEIICVGYAIDNADIVTLVGDEVDILKNLFVALDGPTFPHLVGHNLIQFDLPFIYRRALVCGVSIPLRYPKPAELKAWSTSVTDTMVEWAGVRDRVSLDMLAKVFGLGGKGDITGADVYPMWREGRINEIAEYCKADVELTRAVYRRLTGNLTKEAA